MSRRAFISDLAKLCASNANNDPEIHGVRRGDDDGSFKFVFKAVEAAPQEIEITVLIPDLSDYPFCHQVYVYSESADIPEILASSLTELDLTGQSVPAIVSAVCSTLRRASRESKNGQIGLEENYPYDEESDDASVGGWSDDDADMGEDIQMLSPGMNPSEKRSQNEAALKDDLKRAKNAGYKCGVLGDWKGGKGFYVSISIRISKLGISEEALSAWKLESKDYFILLIHYSNYYQRFSFLTSDHTSYYLVKGTQMCLGTHSNYKPTLLQAMAAFSNLGRNVALRNSNEKNLEDLNAFNSIFISGPLKELLENRLVPLIRYRLKFGIGWDGAELFYDENQAKGTALEGEVDDRHYQVSDPKNALPPVLCRDELSEGAKDTISFPLVAMQFTMRHLVRCTEFCLVCHNKLSTDFEALKPYVCSNPLCLYQYMTLGLGPGIEHEITNHPSVVDLLVSFCYAAARAKRLKSFPQGMNLMVPNNISWPGMYHRLKNELIFEGSPPVKVGDWIRIKTETHPGDEWHGRVIETSSRKMVKTAPLVYLKGTNDSATLEITALKDMSMAFKILGSESLDLQEVKFQIYDFSFDALETNEKINSIIGILLTLPSVSEMKLWLETNSKIRDVPSLKIWSNRISPAALGILRWIIASNRSCIVPLEDETEKLGAQKVVGMDGWKQFRFAMGAPDKEHRFANSVKQAQLRLNSEYPSLFAFHGSPLPNWHSIIREGLHYKERAHGRSYGDGCYHSLDLCTSTPYCNFGVQSYGPTDLVWPQSSLKIQNAVCLNEIVNSPNEFKSKHPHLVIQQLDWMQTRYLFVTTNKGRELAAMPTKESKPTVVQKQDPQYTPRNKTSLIIPAFREKIQTRSVFAQALAIIGNYRNGLQKEPDSLSVCTTGSDMEALYSHEEGRNTEIDKVIHQDKFIPGLLNSTKIKILPPPSYATPLATKRLNSDLNSIIKSQQSTPLEKLGYYLNPETIENVYQWIVEMHSFDSNLPLAKDMREREPPLQSIVLEIRFGPEYPMSPPFVRVVTPRFLSLRHGGGGHVMSGGAICLELLTNSGWSAVSSMESVFLQVRMAMTEEKPAARLAPGNFSNYAMHEARDAYLRACRIHDWKVPDDLKIIYDN